MFKDQRMAQELVMEALKYHLLPERRPLLQSGRTKPRKATVGTLLAVGGMDANKGNLHSKILFNIDYVRLRLK
jgi:kelch-like protein 1/4/5